VSFFFLNSNFDGSDINSPIIGYLDESFGDGLEIGTFQQRILELEKNTAFRYDNLYYTVDNYTDPLEFYSLGFNTFRDVPYDSSNNLLLEYRLKESQLYIEY